MTTNTRTLLRALLMPCLLMAFALQAQAQAGGTLVGRVLIRVKAANGKVTETAASNALIVAEGRYQKKWVRAAGDGTFNVRLTAGTWKLTAILRGYRQEGDCVVDVVNNAATKGCDIRVVPISPPQPAA